MRKLVMLLALIAAWAAGGRLLAQSDVYNPGAVRGVLYGGEIRYLSDIADKNTKGYCHESIDTGDWMGPWYSCTKPSAKKDLPSGYSSLYAKGVNDFGQGMAVFGALLINVSVVLDSKDDPSVLLTTFDLDQSEFVDCKVLCPLGYSNGSGKGYGVAAAVLNNTVYVFTRDFVLTSCDGQTYSQTKTALADGLDGYEPTDAVTFYPPGDAPPKVLVAFIQGYSGDHEAAYVVWDGTTALPLDSTSVVGIGSKDSWFICGVTMLGTVKKTDYSKNCSYPSGSTNPCVQIFLWSGENNKIDRYEYDTTTGVATSQSSCDPGTILQFKAFPWFETKTESSGFWYQEQYIVLNMSGMEGMFADFGLPSDFMVPQFQDPAGTSGFNWQGIPTDTGCVSCTPSYPEQWRTYWSLAGVVLGPPPFAINGIDPSDENQLMALSNVFYGSDTLGTIQHTTSQSKSVMFSSDTTVKAGPSKDAGSLFNLDLSYKHGWSGSQEQSTTYTADVQFPMGTQGEATGDPSDIVYLGTHGYAIFVAPVLITQEMWLYAYDYDASTNSGTKLNQELTTVVEASSTAQGVPPGISLVKKYFELQAPGGPQDEIPGLMTMQVDPDTGQPYNFPISTDLNGWNSTVWEPTNSKWKVIYGTSTGGGQHVTTLSFGGKVTFTDTQNSTTTQGYTNAVSISAGLGIFNALKLNRLDGDVTAGYDSEWTNQTTDVSQITQSLEMDLMMVPPTGCTSPDWYSEWVVQPYLLLATDSSAPWIPQNYGLNLPWCITWFATGTACTGSQTGVSPQPDGLSGIVTGGASGGSSYSIKGATLVWLENSGILKPIPLTADTFDPALGATLELNKHVLSATPSAGKWTRKGQVWSFKSKGAGGKNRVTLQLDFGAGTWSFDGEKLSLASTFKPCDTHVMARLTVNGLYIFRFDAEQEVKTEWKLVLPRADDRALEITRFEGHFGWADRPNKVLLEGRLPSAPGDFGDISFVVNGHQRDIPLLSLKGFRDALLRGKQIVYKSGGTKVVVDFGKRKWSAEFEGEGVHSLMAPRWGGARLSVKVGGKTLYAKEHPVTDFRTELRFKG